MRKMLSLILAVFVMLCSSVSAFAESDAPFMGDDDISFYYLYTNSNKSDLAITSKTAECTSTIRGISGITTKIVVTQYLEKKNGSSWETKASWSKTYNTWLCTFTNTKGSLSSGTYRVKTVAKVYKGTSYETVTSYSTTVSC